MYIRTSYTVKHGPDFQDRLHLPIELTLEEGEVQVVIDSLAEDLKLTVKRNVRPGTLQVVRNSKVFRQAPSGELVPLAMLRVLDDLAPENVIATDVLNAVTFLTDVTLALGFRDDVSGIFAETADEQAELDEMGTDKLHEEWSASLSPRTFNADVDAAGVFALLRCSAGLRLYADALKLSFDVARYREFWRVLESAFQRTDESLIELLSTYAPAQQMEFTHDELKRLLILRGRASHAKSRMGYQELLTVERDCRRAITRLKNLVERVLLTKKEWGQPSVGVDELTELGAYVKEDGSAVFRRSR